jgi:hypothetical protein
MEKFIAQMKDFLKMESELPYEEFTAYYQDFINFLNTDYQSLDQENLINAKFISSILHVNAEERGKGKGPNAKKFKKMSEKGKFWADAINYKLLKAGMTQEQIDKAYTDINEAM